MLDASIGRKVKSPLANHLKKEPIAIDRVDSFLLVVGIGLGLLTGLAFLLLMGAGVGIGMGGGLKDPKVVMSGFILAASFSVLCVGAGICLRVRYGKRSDAYETSTQQGKEKQMNKLPSHQVREHILTQGEDPTTSSHSGICTTVDVTADCGDSFWIQLHRGMINFEHQDIPEKDDVLGSIIDAFPVPDAADLEPGNSMTFEISKFSSEQLDQLIDRLVQEYFDATSPDAISCRSERL